MLWISLSNLYHKQLCLIEHKENHKTKMHKEMGFFLFFIFVKNDKRELLEWDSLYFKLNGDDQSFHD
jgi:hypothetical protein